MDKQLSPPLRIEPIASSPVESSSAIEELSAFLHDYEGRHAHGDHATTRAQINRLLESLKRDEEEAGIQRRKGKGLAVRSN